MNRKFFMHTESSSYKKCSTITAYLISGICALPTALLNGLSALQGGSVTLERLSTFSELTLALTNSQKIEIAYGIACFLASESVLLYLNKKYLLSSSKMVLTLAKKDLCYLLRIRRFQTEKPNLSENIIFFWCFLTSLIFAELGAQTLSSLGKTAEIFGFFMNLSVYFSTRYAGAKSFFSKRSDASVERPERWVYFTGGALAFFSLAPIIVTFIPVSVQGLQNFLQSNLGASENYQDMFSLTVGAVCAFPTAFFYAVSAKKFPGAISSTFCGMVFHLRNGEILPSVKIFMATLLAFSASYFTSVGFRMVADTAISEGYLSYLGSPLEKILPSVFLGTIVVMFWSHLQDIANQKFIKNEGTENNFWKTRPYNALEENSHQLPSAEASTTPRV